MATVWIPPLLQELTGGEAIVEAAGSTVGELVDGLERRYPGLGARLFDDGRLRPGIAVTVDGAVAGRDRAVPLEADSEVHFLPAMNGG